MKKTFNKYRGREHRKGFTMVEALVVLAIITIMTTLILANYRHGEKKYAVLQTAQKLVTDIRKAQNMSLAGAGIEAGRYCGYGLHFSVISGDEFKYILFGNGDVVCADGNTKTKYTATSNASETVAASDVLETVNLPKNIKITSLAPAANKIDLFYEPPLSTIYINKDDTLVQPPVSITLQYGDDSSIKRVITIYASSMIISE